MKICIDGLGLSNLMGTGCYSYLYGLCNSLFQIYPQPEYSILVNDNLIFSEWSKYKNIQLIDLEMDRHSSDYTILEKEIQKNKINLYISPNNGFSIPTNKVCKYIMMVHDLAPLSISNMVDYKYSNKFHTMFPKAVKNADAIIADSEFLKNEIIHYYAVDEKKISVIYPGCLNIFKPMNKSTINAVLMKKYGINDKYILYAGSIHQRKNLDVLLSAFQLLVNITSDYKLVLVGDIGGKRLRYYQYLNDLIRTYKLQEKVVFMNKINYLDMPFFYNGATCVVNISSYEGFPITAIEASSCGVPYICLHNTSFAELNIPTGIYLEKLNADLLKDTIYNVINNEKNVVFNKTEQSTFYWESEIIKFIRVIENVIY